MIDLLPDFWYLATASRSISPGQTLPITLLGQAILLGRSRKGTAFAYADHCPHRGMPMRYGKSDGKTLQCSYHGWQFSTETGRCVEIPALCAPDSIDPKRFGLKAFPCREVQGNIWVFTGDACDPAALPAVPTVPGFDGIAPQVSATMRFPCAADVATAGFFDPAHPAFVHTSRWWKSKPAASLRAKEKAFEPDGLGFRMKRHHLRYGANPYRLLGRNVHVDVTIQLPGLRIEHIEGERHSACVLAASTPIDATTTDVHYCVYWSMGWLAPLKPFARWMARDFLRQDYDVAVRLNDARAAFPPPLFVGDADTQIRWFLRVKKEYQTSQTERRPFVNPLREQVLRWRS
jgi:phenylpropionate dioxygenase-like ring-hydroxylating dioxygenase large terminal subunit